MALSDATGDDRTEELDRGVLPTGELPALPNSGQKPTGRKPVRITIKILLAIVVSYFLLPPVLTGFRQAADTVSDVNPLLLVAGFGLQILALFCYSLLTRAALGSAGSKLSYARIFRIQLSTRALSNIVPGGNAAGSALGYRLLTLSGVSGPDAGFALATAGIGSAVVLNIIFWTGLVMSVPFRGVNPLYGFAAIAGIVIMALAAVLVIGLMDGQGRAEKFARWLARKLRFDEDKFAAVLRQVGHRMEELISDRQLLRRVVLWAMINWLLDAASLWVFLRAFGGTLSLDALIVAFGLANILAAIPILPGGLGVVDGTYITVLIGFGLPRRVVAPGVAAYRSAQYLMPIALGAIAYASLRVGPWRIERRDRLIGLRDLAKAETEKGESRLDFTLRFGRRLPDPPASARGTDDDQPSDGAAGDGDDTVASHDDP
ncbi:MAG: flippase-like domain-containing protein [Ilumatobacteraceae bacterium]|nr:flippase-like domain-containing protein [Ilumatobacteraceae bacterium]